MSIASSPRHPMPSTLPVAACPGWTVADLLGHHAGVFCFATAQLRAEPGSDLVAFDPPPAGDPLEVFSATADGLFAAFAAVDPDEHRPNWAGAPTAAFWWRRMAQEAAIHRWDAEAAHTEPDPIDAELAADGVDELADTFLAQAKRRGITGTGETVHLHATDDGVTGEWMFTFTPEGVDVERAHGKGDMAVPGSASDLLLFAWNRRPVERRLLRRTRPVGVVGRTGPDLTWLRRLGPSALTFSTPATASRSCSIHSAWLAPTSFTHQASASDRERAMPASMRVSSTWRSSISSRVITGTLATVKRRSRPSHRAPQDTFLPKRCSASVAMTMRRSRVSSRKPLIRADAATRRAVGGRSSSSVARRQRRRGRGCRRRGSRPCRRRRRGR